MTSKVLFSPLFPQTVSTLTNIPSCDPACHRGYRQCNGSRDEKGQSNKNVIFPPQCTALHYTVDALEREWTAVEAPLLHS